MITPARIGSRLVSSVETPAVARAVPRWKESWTQTKPRPWQTASTRTNTYTGSMPPTAAFVATSPAEYMRPPAIASPAPARSIRAAGKAATAATIAETAIQPSG